MLAQTWASYSALYRFGRLSKVFIYLSGIINPFLLTILYISVSRISIIVLSLVLYEHVFSYQLLDIGKSFELVQSMC